MPVVYSPQQPDTPVARPTAVSPEAKVAAAGGLVTLVILLANFIATTASPPGQLSAAAADAFFGQRTSMRSYGLLFGTLLITFLLHPVLLALARRFSACRLPYTRIALLIACVFVSAFVVHEGRHQFGGFDYGILIDIGWRQIQGQHLYSDFIAPTPPGFNLGVKYAFELFGVSWNANLYLSALFATGTLLWIYLLLRVLGISSLAAIGTAFAIEAESMLLLSFWWYNNTALVMAAVFLLACLAYIRAPQLRAVQISYFLSLTLLALMKPNIAGVAIAGAIPLLFIFANKRRQLAILTVAAVAAVYVILVTNHISIPALLASYREAGRDRGGFSNFGYAQLGPVEGKLAIAALMAFAAAWLSLFFPGSDRDRPGIVTHLFFLLALLTAAYGVRTNGDFWLVELAPLTAVAAYIAYRPGPSHNPAHRLTTALLCATTVVSLYQGVLRYRIFAIGPEQFFESTDNENLISGGFLKDMRVAAPMIEMEQEIGDAVRSNPGPYFFGPRVDFNYAVQGLPSPAHFPAWWHPGVSFGREQQPQLVQVWKDHRFETLIFLEGDYTFYPPILLEAIDHDYVRDDRYSTITIYRRRPDR